MHISEIRSTAILRKSILVVAHLDDETLWFSSILDEVDAVLTCFLAYRPMPALEKRRLKSIKEYPLKNIACLGLDEAESFNTADWEKPQLTKFGLKIQKSHTADRKYKTNYSDLVRLLREKISGYENIFTHNPWGEYGHEDHVQVYSVLNKLRQEMGFKLFFPNYCSNQSFKLMIKHVNQSHFNYVTKRTNTALAGRIKSILEKNDCWTWYEDWKWFDTEAFIEGRPLEKSAGFGHLFPLNFIRVPSFSASDKNTNQNRGGLHRFSRVASNFR